VCPKPKLNPCPPSLKTADKKHSKLNYKIKKPCIETELL